MSQNIPMPDPEMRTKKASPWLCDREDVAEVEGTEAVLGSCHCVTNQP